MDARKIILLLLTACLAGIVTSQDCMINKQPFREDNSLSRAIGRWYGQRMIMTSQVSWNGYVLDVYDVKGEIFANSTHLLPSGQCAETTTYSVESFPADKKGHKLFKGDVLGRITYVVKGGTLDVAVLYFCPADGIKDGKCENPQIDVLSRKPTLSEKDETRVAGVIESLCLPEQTFIHKAVAFGNCHAEEPNQKVCETRFIPYFNRFEPLKAMGLWYLIAWNFPEGKGPDADDIMGVTADLKRKGQTTEGTNYYANSEGCWPMPPSTLKTRDAPGKVIQFATYANGSTGYLYETDYESYIILFFCMEEKDGICHQPTTELYSRMPIVSPVILRRFNKYNKMSCNMHEEYVLPSSAYDNCPKKKKEVPVCTCD